VNRDEPLIALSARRHGITDADMIHAFDGGDGPVIVHAMNARPQYRRR